MSFSALRTCVLAALAVACADPPSPRGDITVTDDAGRLVVLDAPARRIVSLIPARTDALLALGAGDRLIARTVWDEHPSLAELPSLGDALTPSLEWIAARDPDLVIAWTDEGSRTTASRLRSLGVPVYASRVETLADVRRDVTDLGALTGLEARADSLLAAMDGRLDSVRAAVAGRERPRVLYLVGMEPPYAAGPGTLIAELLEVAGGTNLMADASAPWPTLTLEALLARDPDMIIAAIGGLAESPAEALARLPGWGALSAVRARRVHALDPDRFNRPGPSAGTLAAELAAILHPGAR